MMPDNFNIQDLMKNFSGNDNMKNQINNYWEMLNEMSENDPNTYQSFVNNNIKKGFEEQKKEKESKEKIWKRRINEKDNFLLRITAPLDIVPLNKGSLPKEDTNDSENSNNDIASKFLVNNSTPKSSKSHEKETKVSKSGKIYINILTHEE